jgi:hypothetical protein
MSQNAQSITSSGEKKTYSEAFLPMEVVKVVFKFTSTVLCIVRYDGAWLRVVFSLGQVADCGLPLE